MFQGEAARLFPVGSIFCPRRHKTPVGSVIAKSRMHHSLSAGGSARTTYLPVNPCASTRLHQERFKFDCSKFVLGYSPVTARARQAPQQSYRQVSIIFLQDTFRTLRNVETLSPDRIPKWTHPYAFH